MEQQWKVRFVAAVLVALAGSVVVVADEAAPAPEEQTAWQAFWAEFHNPTPWLSMGLDHRFRSVSGDSIVTLNEENRNHEWEYQRYRTRWWTKWVLGEDVSFNTRLTWEFRTWDEPRSRDVNFDYDEALFDHFNVTMRNVAGLPLTATVGRQDVILGVGWLVLDGTPLDGSRTIYFDAARLTYVLPGEKTKLDLIYVDQDAESDRWLEPLCDEDRAVSKADERGAIFYLTNTSFEATQLEGFFIYKNDNPIDENTTNWSIANSPKAQICTFGGAVSGTQGEHWKYRAEAALQRGEKEDVGGAERDVKAYGALTNLEYLFKDSRQNSLHIGYEYASGDDPRTNDNEQFDLLWAEWPRWSELFIYTYALETSIAESTNLHRFNVGHKIQLNKQWQLSTDYHALWAAENTEQVPTGPLFLSPNHKFRGHLFTMWAKYKFSSQLYGHLLAEYFLPGDYYTAQNDDDACFVRFNLEYVF